MSNSNNIPEKNNDDLASSTDKNSDASRHQQSVEVKPSLSVPPDARISFVDSAEAQGVEILDRVSAIPEAGLQRISVNPDANSELPSGTYEEVRDSDLVGSIPSGLTDLKDLGVIATPYQQVDSAFPRANESTTDQVRLSEPPVPPDDFIFEEFMDQPESRLRLDSRIPSPPPLPSTSNSINSGILDASELIDAANFPPATDPQEWEPESADQEDSETGDTIDETAPIQPAIKKEIGWARKQLNKTFGWIKRHSKAVILGSSIVAAAGSTFSFYKWQSYQRSEEVMQTNDFLNGKRSPKETLDIFGEKISRTQIIDLLKDRYFNLKDVTLFKNIISKINQEREKRGVNQKLTTDAVINELFAEENYENMSESKKKLFDELASGYLQEAGEPLTFEGLSTLMVNFEESSIENEDDHEIRKLIDSFAKMIMVEDTFDNHANTLPILEQTGSPNSYGYAQINPFTAAEVLERNRQYLKTRFPKLINVLDEIKARKAKGNPFSKDELVEKLELKKSANLIPAVLLFAEVNLAYANTHKTNLKKTRREVDPLTNPRTMSLAVCGYSAKPTSPAVAKLQTVINEIIVFRPDLTQKYGIPQTPLRVDGDLQGETEKAIRLAYENSTKEKREKILQELTIGDPENNFHQTYRFINELRRHLQIDKKLNTEIEHGKFSHLLQICSVYPDFSIGIYNYLLQKVDKEKQKSFYQTFMQFYRGENQDFLHLISSEKNLKVTVPGENYGEFIRYAAELYKRNRLLGLSSIKEGKSKNAPTAVMQEKMQILVNEIIIFNPQLAKSVHLPDQPSKVDGKLADPAKTISALSQAYYDNLISEVQKGTADPGILRNLSEFSNNIAAQTGLIDKLEKEAQEGKGANLLPAFEMRYGSTIALYEYLRTIVPQHNNAMLYELFTKYIKLREPEFYNLLKSKQHFEAFFPSVKYEDFLKDISKIYADSYRRDQNYFGVVPTFLDHYFWRWYKDDRNPMARVVIAHVLFENKIFSKPLAPLRTEVF